MLPTDKQKVQKQNTIKNTRQKQTNEKTKKKNPNQQANKMKKGDNEINEILTDINRRIILFF